MRRAAFVSLALLLAAATASAQSQSLPDSPSTTAKLERPMAAEPANEAGMVAASKPRPTADAAYWSWMTVSAAAMVADVETTVRAVENPRCREVNPLVGDNPTRAKMYALKGSAGALIATLSYVGKKKGWKKWWLIPLVTTGAQGGVAVSNWRTGCF